MKTTRDLKTPIDPRFLPLLTVLAIGLLSVTAWVTPASAQPNTWTVEEAVAEALSAPELSAITEHAVRAAHAEVDAQTAVPNPELDLLHEQMLGDNSASYRESTATIRQPFDLSGWRRRYREVATHNASAIRARREAWRLDVDESVRTAFYAIRYHEERLKALDSWLRRLDERIEGIRARVERGDASTYALRRVEVERLTVSGRRAEEQSRLAESMADLMVWLPEVEGDIEVSGVLIPNAPTTSAPFDIGALPGVEALAAKELSLGLETERWRSPFLRGWEIGAGYRYASAGGDDAHGFVVSLSVPLLFWNPNSAQLRRLESSRSLMREELGFQRSQSLRREEAARQRFEATMAQLAAVSNAVVQNELVDLAEVAFGSGEAPLVELLDAYESLAQLQLTIIDLEWEARRASIHWRRTRGIGAR